MKQTVEILMAAFNGEAFVREQLDSILLQSDRCWHATVSDDKSTDGTMEILLEYQRRYPEQIAIQQSGKRFGNARDHFFHLMRTCAADYMFFCDQDDVWYPDKIQKSMEAMHEAERRYGADIPLLVFSDQTPTDQHLQPLAASLMAYQQQYAETIDYRALLMQNIVTGGAMVINRALAQLAARCADDQQVIMHDWWLAVTAARFGKVIYLDEPLGAYRQHGHNSVGAKNTRSLQHLWNRLTHPGALKQVIRRKKAQAAVFISTYQTQLTQQDMAFLSGFVRAHSGPVFYLRYRSLIHGFFRLAAMFVWG